MRRSAFAMTAALLLLTGCFGGRARAICTPQDGSAPALPQRWSFAFEPADPIFLVGAMFSGTWEVRAEMTGDFVMVASEVNVVASTLRANGIEVTALHYH